MVEKFFVIPPVKHLDLALYNNMKSLYCLAHLCLPEKNPDYKEYIDFFKGKANEGYHVILDNSAAEADLVTPETLIALTKEIMPTEVIAPDYLYNESMTLFVLEEFADMMEDENLLGKVKLFAVPQGKTVGEYLRCYICMLENTRVDVIGLSKLTVPKCFAELTDSNAVSVNRRYLIKLLNELDLIKKPIHCLGMRGISEYYAYKNIPLIRSTDSCYTVLGAINNEELKADKIVDTVNETPHDYFFWKLTDKQIKLAKKNINELKKVIEK